jgi:hypothetical protein
MINPDLLDEILKLETPALLELEDLLRIEKTVRLRDHLLANPGCKVRSLVYGFSGGPGRIMYFKAFNKKDQVIGTTQLWGDPDPKYTHNIVSGGDYFTFSEVPGGECKWMIAPETLLSDIELVS